MSPSEPTPSSVATACFTPGARIGERVRVGDRVIVQMNAVVGADGFSFVPPQPGAVETAKATGQVGGSNAGVQRVNSIGTVVLHDEVEIGPCSTIDRATIAATVIGRGTKLANMVTVAHNCTIGENCMISGHVGIAGSSTIGNRVVLGGQVGISDHIRVGDDSIVAAKAKVIRDVPPKSVMMGVPAAPRSEFFAQQLREARMTRYFGQVDALARRIAAIEGKMRDSGGIGR
jgi:UDP-3-O-[3-hydroxymyristoyl] glucosamine N-acyltransferase